METRDLFNKAKINEMGVIGACILEPSKALRASSDLRTEWFLNGETRKMFGLIKKSGTEQEILRNLVVKAKLGHFSALCMEKAYVISHEFDRGLSTMKEHFASLQLAELIDKIDISEPKQTSETLMAGLQNILSSSEDEQSDSEALLKLYGEAQAEQARKIENGETLIGHSSGFDKLDDIIDGIRKEHFWVVGGYSSMGKTFFALNLVVSLLKQDVKTAIFSLEMSKQDIVGRLLGIITEISSIKLLKGSLAPDESKKLTEAKELLKDKIFCYSEKSSLDEIMSSMLFLKLKEDIGVFVLDYAQLVQDGKSSEYETLRKTSSQLQAFCRKNGVSVIMLSQVSNDAARGGNSFVMGFKGSGAIAASADLAIELIPNETKEERDEKIVNREPFNVLCSIKKNRHGPIRDIELKFKTYCGLFYEDNEFEEI